MPVAETLALGSKVLAAIKTLFGLKESLAKADLAKRTAMAELFEKVAVCLEDAAKEIRAGRFPSGRCQEIYTYAEVLPDRMEGVVPLDEAQEVADALKDAHHVRQLFSLRDLPDGPGQLDALDEAAGTIRALGNMLRV